jgi:hypothetical protein
MPKSLLDTFRTLDEATKQLLADIPSTLFLSFATLSIAHGRACHERLSAEHIVACLEAAGVSAKRKSVSRALARASDRISTTKGLDGDTLYRLMTKGEREVAHYLGGGRLSVVRVDGSTPRTARQTLSEILGLLDESVSICDPYYGVRTLESLDCIPKATAVRFLTAKTNESPQKLSGPFRDFVKERPKVQFRQTSSHSLHDRYVVTTGQLLILGHGLKDIGAKESFIIRLGSTLVPDLVKQIIRSFDEHWKSATEIK